MRDVRSAAQRPAELAVVEGKNVTKLLLVIAQLPASRKDGSEMELLCNNRANNNSISQSVTQSPTSATGKECQSLTITCRFQPGLTGTYSFQTGQFFKRTQPGAEMQRIYRTGRFVVWSRNTEMTFTLEIRDLRVEDSAAYYCQAEVVFSQQRLRVGSLCYTESIHKIYGAGTMVTVTADSLSLMFKNPPLQISAAGDTVNLSCEYSGFCPYTVHWYRQLPEQTPEFLLQRHTTGQQDKGEVSGGRISGSLDPSKKISQLTISKVQFGDSAVYHCALSSRTAQCYRTGREWFKNLSMVVYTNTAL
ncbi:immunoglobulin kappa light chain-like [Pristis pectinata]|uniref:immunoglobulin kappa light chain-like n=1 Tax=Pristis pectinata TaxID=685728 RepID=UPI00223C8E20|nr:immunoglobulin kappa light chain-like [Pristis pectinata]